MNKRAAAIMLLALGATSPPAHAALIVTVAQTGTGVTAVGSGTLDLTGLTVSDKGSATGIWATAAYLGIGGGPANILTGATGPSSFGSGPLTGATGATGAYFGVAGDSGIGATFIYASPDYVSGTPIRSTASFAGQTLSGLGLEAGTYVYTWSSDSLTVRIDPVGTVPLPPASSLFGAALLTLGAAGCGLKRRRAATP